ncbi:AcrR family transcriptional regulator [Microbacteriaceae bacterium SG_E_30_P1]|uniref:AcrR family transcriptional regulator n=1 Tax=Antiquaquibacter oligotrophicus TaxID=2880260 RepID=A0ABT6KKD4_9MICO|nr:TetR/AcrR family transcriptional regulator C-terminal domain-containing protein [Antiquaquibacter oligotrophicus]MDH6180468.1 AcrR family transcriptional regulator [Antiquaquibacter oligotrophicus]UDF13794.1 TetR/AcrR family transcriptional regulator C-terminal domain-containing protein [Antiquaquibacter oligotrophicus]
MGRPKVSLLSRERIARAALEVADDHGRLTLTQLAKHLGVTSPSLYNYVGGLDEVLELMRETIHREQGPKIDRSWPWQEVLRHVAYHDRNSIGQHPWLAADLMISEMTAEEPIASVVDFAEVLRGAGFTSEEVYQVIGTVDLLTAGGALDLGAPDQVFPVETESADHALGESLRANPKGRGRADAVFDFAVESLISALELRLASR